MSTEESVSPSQGIGGVLTVFSSTRFWLVTIVVLSALVPLVLWLDASGGFLGWMRPGLYSALGLALMVATKTFLHFRRLSRKGED
ncbi:MAG: hypothetical protein V3S10_03530 [Dehalococcoidales bacterium]